MSDSEDSDAVVAEVPVKESKKNKKRKLAVKEQATPGKKSKNGSPVKGEQVKTPKTPKVVPKETPEESSEDSSDEDAPEPVPKGGKASGPEGTILDLGKNCHARINEFKNNIYVDFRLYYLPKDGAALKPGNKGISFTPQQWEALKKNIPLIDKALAAKLK